VLLVECDESTDVWKSTLSPLLVVDHDAELSFYSIPAPVVFQHFAKTNSLKMALKLHLC